MKMKILFVIYFILIKFLLEQVFLLKTLSFNCLAISSLAISSLAMDSNPVSKKLTLDGDPLVIVLDIMCCGGCAHPNDYLAILSKNNPVAYGRKQHTEIYKRHESKRNRS